MKGKVIWGVFGILIGAGLIIFGVVYSIHSHIRLNTLINHGTEIRAHITFIQNIGGATGTQIYVTYTTTEGGRYTTRLHIRPGGTYRGQGVDILYNPNNPRQITVRDRNLADPVNEGVFSQVLLLLPIALGIFLVVAYARWIRKAKKEADGRMDISKGKHDLQGNALAFVKATDSEYRQMLKQLLWRDPFVKLLKSKETIPYLILSVGLIILLEVLEGNMLVRSILGIHNTGFSSLVLVAFLGASAGFLALILFQMLMAPIRKWRFTQARKIFLAILAQLDQEEAKRLLSEYPNRKRFGISYHRKKKRMTSGICYVTDSFLFIPGLLLIPRERLEEIKLIFDHSTAMGTDWFEPTGHSEIQFILKGGFPIVFPLKHNYHKSPETAEQIMVWFWQCDPNAPDIPIRTRRAIVTSRGKQAYRT